MTTLEMMNEAAKTGKTYIAGDMMYSVKLGFHDKSQHPWDADCYEYINDIFEEDEWNLLPPTKMTKKQIEEKLGYEIELVHEKVEKQEVNPFYDSDFLIIREGKLEEKRMLIELFPYELDELISQSQYLLKNIFGK